MPCFWYSLAIHNNLSCLKLFFAYGLPFFVSSIIFISISFISLSGIFSTCLFFSLIFSMLSEPFAKTYLYKYNFSRLVNTACPSFNISRLFLIFCMFSSAFSRLFSIRSAKFINVLSSILLVKYFPVNVEFSNCFSTSFLCLYIFSSCPLVIFKSIFLI